MAEKEKYQVVKITLKDGRVGYFAGPVLVGEDEDGGYATEVLFHEGRPLPPGYSFALVEEAKKA